MDLQKFHCFHSDYHACKNEFFLLSTSTLCIQSQFNDKGNGFVLYSLQNRRASTGMWISCLLTHQQNYLPRSDFESHGSSDVLETYGTGQSCPESQMLEVLFMPTELMLKS